MILEHKHIKKNMYKVFIHKEALMGTPTGKRQLGRSRLRWHTQLNKDLSQVGGRVRMVEDSSTWKRLVYYAKNRLRSVAPQHKVSI